MTEQPGPTPEVPQFATLINDRRPQFKTHRTLGSAKNAVGYRLWYPEVRGGTVYRLRDDGLGWDPLYEVPRNSDHRDLPWRKPPTDRKQA